MSNFRIVFKLGSLVSVGGLLVWKLVTRKPNTPVESGVTMHADFTGDNSHLRSEVHEETIPETHSYWHGERVVDRFPHVNFDLTDDEYRNLPDEQYEETIPDSDVDD